MSEWAMGLNCIVPKTGQLAKIWFFLPLYPPNLVAKNTNTDIDLMQATR